MLVRSWGERLQANALAPRVLRALAERESDVQRCALDGLQRENPAFGRAATEQFRQEAIGHCHKIMEVMLAIAAGHSTGLGTDPFRFVRAHAVRRARQQFPLAGSLNAYRLAHRAYWSVMREQVVNQASSEEQANACLMVLSEFLLEYFDAISGAMTDAYIAEETLLVAQRTRTQAALIDDLMHGRPPGDLEARRLCEECGIRPGASIAVAIARPGDPVSDEPAECEAAVHRLSGLVERAASSLGIGRLIDIRDGEVLAILAGGNAAGGNGAGGNGAGGNGAGGIDTARRMADVLRTRIAELRADMDAAVGVGISLEATEVSALPRAHEEAERAVELTEPGRPVIHFADIDLLELLARRPDAAALRLIPAWADAFREADREKSGELSRTIRAFADCSFNVKQTARRLRLHTNTVYFRLNRISTLTGIDPRTYSGVSLLLTTLRLMEARSRSNGNGGWPSRTDRV
jgi:hypothetical protein